MTETALSERPERTGSAGNRGKGYQLTIASAPKLVWFRNAKVGTRTLYALLKQASVNFEIEHGFKVPFDADLYRSHFKFALVRNPWDRFVSGWKNKINHRKKGVLKLSAEQIEAFQDLGRFAEHVATLDPETCNVHFRLQSALIDVDAVDYLGRFENYEAEIRTIFDRLDLEMPDALPHKNRSKRAASYQDYYTPETRELIGRIYREDIERFGYTFEKG